MIILKRFPELVAFIWAIVFTYLLFSGRYVYFLNPKFSYLLVIGLILTVTLFAGGILSTRKNSDPLLLFSNSLLILIPIFYLLNGTNFELGGYAFSKKRTSFISNDLGEIKKSPLPVEMSLGKYYKIPLNSLASPFKNYDGEMVETLGQIHRSKGQKYIALFRFAVTCCAADARPIGIILPLNEKTEHLQKDDWAIVRGQFRVDKYQGKVIRQLRPEEALKVDPPPMNKRYLY